MQRHPAVGIRHVLVICLAVPSCFYLRPEHTACGPGGACPDGFTCRGEFCEFGTAPDDASMDALVDAPPDAPACFGSFVTICLQSAPSAPLLITSLTPLDTGNSPLCAPLRTGPDVCVLAGTTISIAATVRATGSKPLVLLASESLTVFSTGSVDVASHRGATPETGAGMDFTGCPVGTAPGIGGGGAGGSFTGAGGSAGNSSGNGGQAGAPIAGPVTELRGGCAGQDGDGPIPGARGHGGGAVLLIARTAIDHTGVITAAGEGGTGSDTSPSGGGGGGGGAGGMIVLDAAKITGSGLILANGGGGGEGCGTGPMGRNGADPNGTGAATGGTAGSNSGGDGGAGSAGAAAGPGGNGSNGVSSSSGGGGGGGGGAGVIRMRAGQDLGPLVSPAPTPF